MPPESTPHCPKTGVHPRNTRGCCDGHGNTHHGDGATSHVSACTEPQCARLRDLLWDHECGDHQAPVAGCEMCEKTTTKEAS